MNLEAKTRKGELRELTPEELTIIKQAIYGLLGEQKEIKSRGTLSLMEYTELEGWVLEKIGITAENRIIKEKITTKYSSDENQDSIIQNIKPAVDAYFKTAYREYTKKRAERKNDVE
ncbi:hypothetical protein J4225_00690 [Candidatus Pacearchaeota archaeon]|nr:hypothetical protein [Candidatus Pacearchaeota archaeon]